MNVASRKMTRDLSRLLSPRSVAFIGGGECDVAIERTRDLGYAGKIWAVHPKREHLGGTPCIRSVDDIDGTPDAAFVAVRRRPRDFCRISKLTRVWDIGLSEAYAAGAASAHCRDDPTRPLRGHPPLKGEGCAGAPAITPRPPDDP